MKQGNALIGWVLIFAGILFYLYGVFFAINISWNAIQGTDGKLMKMPEGLDAAISSINALLLTNLGAVLGISVSVPGSALSRNILPGSQPKGGAEIKEPMNSRELIQLICVIIFLVSVIACFITWIRLGFNSDPEVVLSFVSQSAKMFIGVVLAYLSFILGKK